MPYDRDYNDGFDHEHKCVGCGCVFDERYFNECPECFLSIETIDPDELYDSRD